MKQLAISLACVALALAGPSAHAGPVEDAAAAARRGDHAAAVVIYQAAAKNGDAEAMYLLGMAFGRGRGVAADEAQALRWFRDAAAKGHGKANFELGQAYDMGRGVAKDRAAARRYYAAAAKGGVDPGDMAFMQEVADKMDSDSAFAYPLLTTENAAGAAAYNGGARAMRGIGQPVDGKGAVPLFEQAVKAGNAQAMAALAQVYADGFFTSKNPAEALRLYRLAADKGIAPAMLALGDIYYRGKDVEQDFAISARWYRAAADKGVVEAMAQLGWMYEQGKGVGPNQAEAVKWLRRAATGGDKLAQYATANAYHDGTGVPRDFVEAAKWYRKAADRGDYGAMLKLGAMYFDGRGVPKNVNEAIRWLRKPPRKYETMDYLGTIYALGLGVPRNGAEAERAYKAAGTAEAHYNLGVLYHNGIAVPKDEAEAQTWFKKAAAGGHEIAKRRLQGGTAAAGIPLDSAIMFDVGRNTIYDPVCTRWASPSSGLKPFSGGAAVRLEMVASGQEGASFVTRFRAVAADPDGDKLSYRYTTDSGTITGDGAEATRRASRAGVYKVDVEVDDGKGCVSTARFSVEPSSKINESIELAKYADPPEWKRPGVLCSRDPRFIVIKDGKARFNLPPVEFEVTPSAGGSPSFVARTTATDPDGDTMFYTYTATSGSVRGDGPSAVWTPGVDHPGSLTVEVYDGRGCTAFASFSRM